MAETEGVSEVNPRNEFHLKRDDLGWREHHESFRPNFGRFDPYENFKFACRLDSNVRAKPVWVVAKPDFETGLELVSAQIAPALTFLEEIVGDSGISIIRVCPTSEFDKTAYLRYGTTLNGDGILFSRKSLLDIASEPQVVQAAIAHELTHCYLDYHESGFTFQEVVPVLVEICFLALHRQPPRILKGELAISEYYQLEVDKAVDILRKRFGLPEERSNLEVFDWLKTEVGPGEITSLLKDEIQKLLGE